MSTVEIFRAGRHTAMSGHVSEHSADDLLMMAAAYAPARSRAVLTLGHPHDNQPNLGTIDKLTAVRGRLFAHISNVSSEAVDWVRAGLYKYVSASFMTPYAPGNPVPGTWYLRHVGMLGAMAPAVHGMAPLEFAAGHGNDNYLCFTDPDFLSGGEGSCAALCADAAEFSAPYGYSADARQVALYRRASHFAAASGLDFADAVSAIEWA